MFAWFSHIFDDYNDGAFEMTENPVTASFIHPGMTFLMFDRSSKPDIRAFMRYFTELRVVVMHSYRGPNNSNFIDFEKIVENNFVFISSAEFEMKRELYNSTPKWPLKATSSLKHVGNSTFSIATDVSVQGSDISLATYTSCFVVVDRESRKSMSLPDWCKEKYSNRALSTTSCRVETLIKPKETFYFEAKVLWSDTDQNDHANYSTYVHYTINALRAALKLQSQKMSDFHKVSHELRSIEHPVRGLRGFCQEIIDSGLKSLRICYTKESVEGDKLDVFLWQEEGDDFGVKAVVEKVGETLCHIHLKYFGASPNL